MVRVRLIALASIALATLAGCTPSGALDEPADTPVTLPDCSELTPDFVPTYWGNDATGEPPAPPVDFPQAVLGLTDAVVECASTVAYRDADSDEGPHFYVSFTGDPQAFDDISGLFMLLDYSLVEDADGVPYDHLDPPADGDEASAGEVAASDARAPWVRTFRFPGDAAQDLAARTVRLTLWRTPGETGDAPDDLELEFW